MSINPSGLEIHEAVLGLATAKENLVMDSHQVRAVFKNLSYGWCAASLFHDENGYGEAAGGCSKKRMGFQTTPGPAGQPVVVDSTSTGTIGARLRLSSRRSSIFMIIAANGT